MDLGAGAKGASGLGNGEAEDQRIELLEREELFAERDGRPDLVGSIDEHAREGSAQVVTLARRAGLGELGARRLELRVGRRGLRGRGLALPVGDGALLLQLRLAARRVLGHRGLRLGGLHRGQRLLHLGVGQLRIELRDERAFRHGGALLRRDARETARDLEAGLERLRGIERPAHLFARGGLDRARFDELHGRARRGLPLGADFRLSGARLRGGGDEQGRESGEREGRSDHCAA